MIFLAVPVTPSLKKAPYAECVAFLTVVPHWSNPGGTTAFESLRRRINCPARALSASVKNVIDLPVRPARPVRPIR